MPQVIVGHQDEAQDVLDDLQTYVGIRSRKLVSSALAILIIVVIVGDCLHASTRDTCARLRPAKSASWF